MPASSSSRLSVCLIFATCPFTYYCITLFYPLYKPLCCNPFSPLREFLPSEPWTSVTASTSPGSLLVSSPSLAPLFLFLRFLLFQASSFLLSLRFPNFPLPVKMSTDSNPSDREGLEYDPYDDPISIDSSSATPSREPSPDVVPESPLPQPQEIVSVPSSPYRPSSAPTAGSGTLLSRPSTSEHGVNILPPLYEPPSSSSAQPSVPPPLLRNWQTHRSFDPDRPFDPLELDVLIAYRPVIPQSALRQTTDLLAPLEEGVSLVIGVEKHLFYRSF